MSLRKHLHTIEQPYTFRGKQLAISSTGREYKRPYIFSSRMNYLLKPKTGQNLRQMVRNEHKSSEKCQYKYSEMTCKLGE